MYCLFINCHMMIVNKTSDPFLHSLTTREFIKQTGKDDTRATVVSSYMDIEFCLTS
uniref:Uncharacterized protein n=1 Tax=Arion vulgaris TaxID=1028688 RepID=A0A0B7ABG5_9EUPU